MPYEMVHGDSRCPSDKPVAVVNKETNRLHGCHPNEDAAKKQMAALYVHAARGAGSVSRERRYTPAPVEYRAAEGGAALIGGYAAVFGSASRNLGGFTEVVRPEFFNRAASRGWENVVARFNHDDNMLLGSTAAQTLRLHTDDEGLAYQVEPPKSRADVVELVQRGDVRFSSFAFYIIEDDWDVDDRNYPRRNLISGDLVDVSPVVNPAYQDTTAAYLSLARHMDADPEEIRSMAEHDELKRLFTPAAGPVTHIPVSGPKARMDILSKKNGPPTD